MRALLDVSVLLALFDGSHEHHRAARRWLERHIHCGWASCAITQNGFVRIISQPRYPGAIGTTDAIQRLGRATTTPQHEYWPCSLSICDEKRVRPDHLTGHRQVTDAYLLALAVQQQGRFVTLDRRISPLSVSDAAPEHLVVI
ncbi:MAG: TA system VapC family ribonuclease toxin [Pseudomonadota bacterium]